MEGLVILLSIFAVPIVGGAAILSWFGFKNIKYHIVKYIKHYHYRLTSSKSNNNLQALENNVSPDIEIL